MNDDVSHKTGHMTSHTVSPMNGHNCDTGADSFQRIEVITGVGRRRRWSSEEKARMVSESLVPGASVLAVGRRYGVNPNQLYAWRRQFSSGEEAMFDGRQAAPGFTPMIVGDPPPQAEAKAGTIEVAVGRIVVRVDGLVDASSLYQVLDVIRRLG